MGQKFFAKVLELFFPTDSSGLCQCEGHKLAGDENRLNPRWGWHHLGIRFPRVAEAATLGWRTQPRWSLSEKRVRRLLQKTFSPHLPSNEFFDCVEWFLYPRFSRFLIFPTDSEGVRESQRKPLACASHLAPRGGGAIFSPAPTGGLRFAATTGYYLTALQAEVIFNRGCWCIAASPQGGVPSRASRLGWKSLCLRLLRRLRFTNQHDNIYLRSASTTRRRLLDLARRQSTNIQ